MQTRSLAAFMKRNTEDRGKACRVGLLLLIGPYVRFPVFQGLLRALSAFSTFSETLFEEKTLLPLRRKCFEIDSPCFAIAPEN